MICTGCGDSIPEARLKAIPDTKSCVNCSKTQPYKGYMVYGHKTGGSLVAIRPEESENIRQADRANKRSR